MSKTETAGFLVVLDHDVPEEKAQDIMRAIAMIKSVSGVEPVTGGLNEQIAETRRDAAWREALIEFATGGIE
jgi:hypothetical protein